MSSDLIRKSTFRQPMRTLLLMALAAAASFAFVANLVEYIAMSGSAERIGGYYRSIGYLSATGAGDTGSGSVGAGATGSGSASANVYPGAEIVASSRYVDFEDRRRGVDAVLQGMKNADIRGMRPSYMQFRPWRHTDAFFFGTLTEIDTGTYTYAPGDRSYFTFLPEKQPYIKLTVQIDSVLEGYPEFAVEGQDVVVYYFLEGSELDAYFELNDVATEGDTVFPATQLDGMEIGRRYFLRGAYYLWPFVESNEWSMPERGSEKDVLNMCPLNEAISHEDETRTADASSIWFVPMEAGGAIGSSVPGLENLSGILFQLGYDQSAVQLRATSDMSAMPFMQESSKMMRLAEGRMPDRDDDISSNHVVVISKLFADIRGVSVGDTITVGISNDQRITGIWSLGDMYVSDIMLTSVPQEPAKYELELEVVGIYIYINNDLPRMGYGDSYPFNTMYVPDSVLPGGYEARPAAYLPDGFGYPEDGSEYLPAVWYSFVLRDARDEDAFLRENEERLAALGYIVRFLPTNALAFWESAAPILRGAAFNAVVFSAALVAVLALVAFLFMRQRRKDYAIARALGSAAKPTSRQLLSAVSLVGFPAVAIGSVAAWFFALGRASAALEPLGEVAGLDDIASLPLLPLWWLPVLAVAAFAVLLGLSAIGAAAMSRKRTAALL